MIASLIEPTKPPCLLPSLSLGPRIASLNESVVEISPSPAPAAKPPRSPRGPNTGKDPPSKPNNAPEPAPANI